ncbi:MAG: diaminopimelate decarboxylase [Oscillospiraceae bacterium]|nr:diaminopimelate decarboxylase [Oscillospiraceae bacterium]
MLHENYSVNAAGHLCLNGADTTVLAEKYGTPLYLLDEDYIRARCRLYKRAMEKYFGNGSSVLYASKANSFKKIYRIIDEEGLGTDVVSSGELYTALEAGFPAERIFFHGNAKTDEDIRFGVESGVGCFVADNYDELRRLDKCAGERGVKQKLILRVTPGIDTHTFEAVNTGKVDSKFGAAIETGQAMELTEKALAFKNLELLGFHCHVGSQVFDPKPFLDTAEIMIGYLAAVRDSLGFTAQLLDIGGGFGVRYVESDPQLDVDATIHSIAEYMKAKCSALGFPLPKVLMEPGRGIVAAAGVTVYTVESVKTITGFKSYAAIDGGMTDNPRYALYRSQYTVYPAGNMNANPDFVCDVVGRCCESGDIICPNARIPMPKSGDLLAVAVTGAYNFSMASNYNSIPRPPIVMVSGYGDHLAVRRESFADMTARQL